MFFEPLAGWRTVMTRERRAKVDWADCMRRLLEEHDPDAEKVVLVMDNLNTHGLSTFYEAFAPKRSLRRRPADWPGGSNFTTPPSTAVGHGSWLNRAEIENSAMARQCLSRRIPEKQVVEEETAAWSERRNEEGAAANWRFQTEDARIKLRRLYPNIDDRHFISHRGPSIYRRRRSPRRSACRTRERKNGDHRRCHAETASHLLRCVEEPDSVRRVASPRNLTFSNTASFSIQPGQLHNYRDTTTFRA